MTAPGTTLVTGADGYIGAVLVPRLVAGGHRVISLDTGYYRTGLLYGADPGAGGIAKDIRDLSADDLASVDAVVHLAELSNDPLCQHDPALTREINHLASSRLARLAKAAGVRRFVYASSCSVYGASGPAFRDESSETDPQTAYAACKLGVEADLRALADADFTPVILRNATAFGASPRMRFDIVLNNLAGLAWTTGEIAMTSDGTPWRPLVHVEDIARAIACALAAPAGRVAGEILNVGSDDQNYRVREIAEIVGAVFPGCRVSFGALGGDTRSYRVSFAKICEVLPAFVPQWDAHRGAVQLREIFERIGMTREVFEAPPFTRLRMLERLLSAGDIDPRLRWRVPDRVAAR